MVITDIETFILYWFVGLILISFFIGIIWGKSYSDKMLHEVSSVQQGFKRLLINRIQIFVALIIAGFISYGFSYFIAYKLNTSIEETSNNKPVSQFVLESMGYANSKEALVTLRTQMNLKQKEDMWLYEQFVKELFTGNVPAQMQAIEGEGFNYLKKALNSKTLGGKGYYTEAVHSEFTELFGQLKVSTYLKKETPQCKLLSQSNANDGKEESSFCLAQHVLPLPVVNPVFQNPSIDPANYLRSKKLEGQGDNISIWLKILMFSYGSKSLTAEQAEFESKLWQQYVTYYLAMFEEEQRQQARFLGPIQFLLYLLFSFAVMILAKRITFSKSKAAIAFMGNLFHDAAPQNTGKDQLGAEKKKAWHSFLDDFVYVPVNYMIWAIPSVGFIGTVVGISESLGKAYLVVVANGKAEQALAVGKVTELLSLAFDTTLIALILNVFLMALMYFVRADESRLLYKPLSSA